MSSLEVHHIHPKSRLYKAGYRQKEVNAIANFCFLTKDTNLKISNRLPADYFEEIEEKHPGALASQWIPMDRSLWQMGEYLDFLAARRELLAKATNTFMTDLLHDDSVVVAEFVEPPVVVVSAATANLPGSIDSEEEEAILLELAEWVMSQGLPEGDLLHELSHPETGQPEALLDLAWPHGLQEGLSSPVAVLLNEGPATYDVANNHGYRYFTNVPDFRRYVIQDVLAGEDRSLGAAG